MPPWLKHYVGLPFEKYNCWQLVCLVYLEQFAIRLPTYADEYQNYRDKDNIKKIYERELGSSWRRVSRPEFGNIIALRVEGQPWHVGMIVDKHRMLHTDCNIDSVIERFDGPLWERRIIGFYEYSGK